MTERQRTAFPRAMRRHSARVVAVCGAVVALAMGMAACASGQPSSSNRLTLAQIPWCDQPSITFQDDSKLTSVTLTDWTTIKQELGFTPYLPTSLPKGTCLALAGGSVHDPIYGGRFLITYYLPGSGPLSFSEAPKNANAGGHLSSGVQCSQSSIGSTPTAASATPTASATPAATSTPVAPLTICLGTVSGTNITVASAMSPADLQAMYKALQPNVDWVPPAPKTTPTATVTAS